MTASFTSAQCPVLINCRDRVSALRLLVAWLEQAGHERIILVDNASTYPPLLDYLDKTPHEVVRLDQNLGSRTPWVAELVPAGWYVCTDPDIVPVEECPLDAIARLHELLERHPKFSKAGLGLHLDDVPETLPSLEWERSLVSPERELSPGVYDSLIDTTFALYRPGAPFEYEAIRTGAPYEARHLPWYVTEPDGEDRYYLDRAMFGPLGSSWEEVT